MHLSFSFTKKYLTLIEKEIFFQKKLTSLQTKWPLLPLYMLEQQPAI